MDDFDKKTNYSNIKWEENSCKNFDSNNEIINILRIDKNMNLDKKYNYKNNIQVKINLKEDNSNSNFIYNMEEEKNSLNKNINLLNEEKEIYLFNENLNYTPSRNTSDLNKMLLYLDEKNSKNDKIDNIKENNNNNINNTLRNYSFEKMINKKFRSNRTFKNNNFNQYTNNDELENNNINKKNTFNRINIKEVQSKKINENKNIEKNKINKTNDQADNPLDKYFQKRHLREKERLENLRQEKIEKEISEIKDRPSISDSSKKIFNQKFQENKNFKNVFERLLSPSQVKIPF